MPNKYYSDPVFYIRWSPRTSDESLGHSRTTSVQALSQTCPIDPDLSTLIPLVPPMHFLMIVMRIPGNGEIRSEI